MMAKNDGLRSAYVYTITVDNVVRYVGKGTGKRMFAHVRDARRELRLQAGGKKPNCRYIVDQLCLALRIGSIIQESILVGGLTEEEAFAREEIEIAAAPQGQLWNAFGGYRRGSRKLSPSNPRTRARLSAGQKARFSSAVEREKHRARMDDPEFRAQQSKAAKQRYSDPKERARMQAIAKEVGARPTVRAKLSANSKARWSDPEYRVKSSAAIKVGHNTPEARANLSASSKKIWEDPDRREDFSKWAKASWAERKSERKEALKAAWDRPETRAKHRAYLDSPEGRANLAAASNARWAKHRAKVA